VDCGRAFLRQEGVVMAMRSDAVRQRAGRARMPFEFGLAAGSLTMIVAALIDSAAFAPDDRGDRLAVMAAAVAVFCAVAGWRSGLPVAAVGYLLFDGFLANRYGELTWAHQAGPHAIGVIASAAALGLVVGWLRSSPYRAAPTIRLSVDKSRRRSGTRDEWEGRGAETGFLRLHPLRNRSAATPMSLRRSATDDRAAAISNTAVSNTAIDKEKETRGG
jgi:hypothetical protein